MTVCESANRWPMTILAITFATLALLVLVILFMEWRATCPDCPHDCGCAYSDCYCSDRLEDRVLRGEVPLRVH
jgi:hypothetical protein